MTVSERPSHSLAHTTWTMKLRSVLISDAVDQACVDILQRNNIQVTLKTKLTIQQLIDELKKHDALIVRSDTKVTAEVIASSSGLKLVGRAGTGVDNIDLETATKRGVIVMNTPGGNSISACELTCTLIASLARHVAPASAALKQGSWERKQFAGTELYGKTLAVLGLGRIGREVARRMQAFGMKTIGYDPIISRESAAEFEVEKLELDEIWPRADYITVHTPLIPQTRNLINAEVLGRCRRGVRVVNVARGGIVDEAALLTALEAGQCGGAALDVFTEEPPRTEGLLKLLAHPRVLATPHLGASTAEAQKRVAEEIAEQFVALAQGASVSGIVNAPIMCSALEACNTPWIKLSQYLGCVASHLVPRSLPGLTIRVETFGPQLSGMRWLSTAVLLGQLAGATENGINLINAPALAREAGITVESLHLDDKPLQIKDGRVKNGLRINICQEGKTPHSVTGTVRDGTPLLLAIDDHLEFSPQGLALSGNVALFTANQVNPSLASIVGLVCGMECQVVSLSATSVTPGYIAIHTAAPLDKISLPPNVTLVAKHTFA